MSRERRVKDTFATVIEAKGDEPKILISTSAIDREGDIVEPLGAQLENYRRNPVVLFGHDHFELPIGSTTSIVTTSTGLEASWRWLEDDERAARVRNAFNQGALRAASIGFIPLETEALGRDGGRRYVKWEMLEWSLVPVPANPEAVRVLRSLGLSEGTDHADLRRIARQLKKLRANTTGMSPEERKHLRAAERYLSLALNRNDARGSSRQRDDLIEIVNDDVFDVDVRDLQVAVRSAARDAASDVIMRLTGRVDLD